MGGDAIQGQGQGQGRFSVPRDRHCRSLKTQGQPRAFRLLSLALPLPLVQKLARQASFCTIALRPALTNKSPPENA